MAEQTTAPATATQAATPQIAVDVTQGPKTVLRLTRHSIFTPGWHPLQSAEEIEAIKASAARQLSELRRIFGDDVVVMENQEFTVPQGGSPLDAVNAAIEATGQTIAALEMVLPPALLQPLLPLAVKGELPMIMRAAMSFGPRRPDGEPPAPASFERYERLVKYDIVVETL